MRDANTRKQRANFVKALSDILTDQVNDDEEYFKRLLWANEWIALRLSEFEEGEEE